MCGHAFCLLTCLLLACEEPLSSLGHAGFSPHSRCLLVRNESTGTTASGTQPRRFSLIDDVCVACRVRVTTNLFLIPPASSHLLDKGEATLPDRQPLLLLFLPQNVSWINILQWQLLRICSHRVARLCKAIAWNPCGVSLFIFF